MPFVIVASLVLLFGSIGTAKYQYERAETALAGKRAALAQVIRLESTIARQKGRIDTLESEKAQLEGEVFHLKQELQNEKWKNAKIEAELKETKEQLTSVTEELKQAKLINRELQQVVGENKKLQRDLEKAAADAEGALRNKLVKIFKTLPIVPVLGGAGSCLLMYGVWLRRRAA